MNDVFSHIKRRKRKKPAPRGLRHELRSQWQKMRDHADKWDGKKSLIAPAQQFKR